MFKNVNKLWQKLTFFLWLRGNNFPGGHEPLLEDAVFDVNMLLSRHVHRIHTQVW